MSVRIFLSSIPTIKHFKVNNLIQNHVYCIEHNSTLVHKRRIFKDASKNEIVEGRKRVYYGVLTPQIRAIKWFSLTTSAISLLAQPFLVNTLYTSPNVVLVVAASSFIGFFTFVNPFLLHFITKKYVTHLDYDLKKQSYIASTVNFFCMLKEIEFTPADVKVPDIPGMFTTCIVKEKPIFLEPQFFQDPSHYAKIMGYDRPINLKLYADETNGKKTK